MKVEVGGAGGAQELGAHRPRCNGAWRPAHSGDHPQQGGGATSRPVAPQARARGARGPGAGQGGGGGEAGGHGVTAGAPDITCSRGPRHGANS